MAGAAIDVFLSYKSEDRRRLKPLVDALEAEGFSLWWDAQIGGGANWHDVIEEHLASARCVLVAWTKRSVGQEGNFVRDEARRAQRRGAYLPIRLDAVEPPLGFGEVQALPLYRWKGDRTDPKFQAIAQAIRNTIAGETVAHARAYHHEPRISRRVLMAGGAGVAAMTGLGAGGWLLLKPTTNTKRVAVMPFANLSGDKEQAFFCEGIAEELRGALTRIGLEVIGRASSEAVKDLDIRAAASKLGVSNVLTGSVRRSAETIRITAQLVGGFDGVERWAQTYDRAPGDAIKIQTDIATNVLQALSIALGRAGRAALTLGGTTDSTAQSIYLQANEQFHTVDGRDAFREIDGLLNAAIRRDPSYADAYILKSRSLELLASDGPESPTVTSDYLAQAEIAAKHALEIAPGLGAAYTVLALINADQLNFRGAVQNNQRALAVSPNDPDVISQGSIMLQYFGDAHRALELADRGIALDPLRATSYGRKASIQITLRQYAQSIESARKALELAPQHFSGHLFIGSCLTLMNQFSRAKAEFEKTPVDNADRLKGEALAAARSHDRAGAEQIMARLRRLQGASASYQYAQIYAQGGDIDRAFAELNVALRIRDTGLGSLKTDPFLDPIRGDARYTALLSTLNFP